MQIGDKLQSDITFSNHNIADKISSARKQIGMTWKALYWAPKRAKLIVYIPVSVMPSTSRICLLCLGFVFFRNEEMEVLDMMQNLGVTMICRFKGNRGVTQANEKVQLEQSNFWHKNYHVKAISRNW